MLLKVSRYLIIMRYVMKQAEQTATRLKAICQETEFGFPKITSHQGKTKDRVATITKRLADVNQLLQY